MTCSTSGSTRDLHNTKHLQCTTQMPWLNLKHSTEL